MAYKFRFPDVGEGITEGEIVKWNVKEGDTVKADQPIVEIETDKAIVEIPTPKSGTIARINYKEGEVIKVGEVLVEVDEEGKKEKKKSASKDEHYTGSVVGFLEEAAEETKTGEQKKVKAETRARKHVKATPKVRAIAKRLGIDISAIAGTGPGGRILEEDLGKKKPMLKKQLRGLRKSIAEHLHKAHTISVPVTNFHDADVTKLWDIRKKEKMKAEKEAIKVTFIPFIIKAVVKALPQHPIVHAMLGEKEIIFRKECHIGIAVDTPEGLIVPVIKDAEKKKLQTLAKVINELAEKARKRKLELSELQGGTFTITNLGSIGVKYFTPMLNYPESAILGVGRIEQRPVVVESKIVVRKIMPLSFTYDHRIIDGAEAARFMLEIIQYLEEPYILFRD